MTIELDADLHNADWTKRTWDLPARNVDELRAWLKEQGMMAAAFKRLPVYQFNVDKLPWLRTL